MVFISPFVHSYVRSFVSFSVTFLKILRQNSLKALYLHESLVDLVFLWHVGSVGPKFYSALSRPGPLS